MKIAELVIFEVFGTPVQEGNISFGRGHSYHREGERLTSWRSEIAAACLKQRSGPLWVGPVELRLAFNYAAPRKRFSEQPKLTRPDLSKLVRAVEDALTGVLYADDNQITKLEAYKYFAEWGEKTSLLVNACLYEERD